MKLAFAIAFLLFSITSFSVSAQNNMFEEAFTEFATSRLWEFEEIPIEWKMKGFLQTDLNEGLNNLIEQNLNAAEASLTIVISKDSSIWQAYYYRAVTQKKLKLFINAEKDMQRALNLHGEFYEGLVELAKIFALRSMPIESERAVNRAIKLDRTRGEAYYLKGDINMWQGDMHGAVNKYKACLEVDSLFHDARIKLALIDGMAKQNVNTALKHLDAVLAYDSLQKMALLFRGVLGFEKQKEPAVKDFTNLLLVSPNNLLALYNRGLLSAELGNYQLAFNDFRKVIEQTSTSDNNFVGQQSWVDKKIDLQNVGGYAIRRMYGMAEDDRVKIRQAYCQIIIGKYEKCIDVLGTLSDPRGDALAVYLYAVAHEHSGNHAKAFEFYLQAVALDNQIVDAHKKLGIYYQELKDWRKSVMQLTAVLTLDPNAFVIHKIRGVSYWNLQMYKDAEVDYTTYLKNNSTDKQARMYRGMVYKRLQRPLEAYIDYAQSENLQQLDFSHIARLVDSVLYVGDTLQALKALDVITNAAPNFTEGYYRKFKIHMARNEWSPISESITIAMQYCSKEIPKRKYSYLLTLHGLYYAENKNQEQALNALSDAIKNDAKNDLAYLERGRVFQSLGKTSKAKNDFVMASSLGNQRADRMLAELAAIK